MVGKTAWWLDELRWAAEECAKGGSIIEDDATRDAIELLTGIDCFRRLLQEIESPGLRVDLHDGVARLANAAIWLGIRRSANLNQFLRREAVKEFTSRGGKARVAAKREKTDETERTALSIAQQICNSRTKFIAQEGLADQIRAQWPEARKPSKKLLIKFISKWDGKKIDRFKKPPPLAS